MCQSKVYTQPKIALVEAMQICEIPESWLCWENTFLRMCEAVSSGEVRQLLTYFTDEL
jgi:hypothetical protein